MRFPTPTALMGDLLEAELDDAGLPGAQVVYYGDEIEINVDEEHRPLVEQVLATHAASASATETFLASEETNERTILDRLAAAIGANTKDISDTEKWLTDNPNASPILRSLANQSVRQGKQLIGLERLLLRRLESAE